MTAARVTIDQAINLHRLMPGVAGVTPDGLSAGADGSTSLVERGETGAGSCRSIARHHRRVTGSRTGGDCAQVEVGIGEEPREAAEWHEGWRE